jgi:Protein of unknown function (DUF3309)
MYYLLIVLLLVLAVGALPHWPYATGWGYGYWPSGFLGLLILILIILMATGRGV